MKEKKTKPKSWGKNAIVIFVCIAAFTAAIVVCAALVIAKFAEYIITSRVVISRAKWNTAEFVRDPLGRCAAVFYFLLPGEICIFNNVPGLDFRLAVDLATYTAVLLTLFSSSARCRHCINTILRGRLLDER